MNSTAHPAPSNPFTSISPLETNATKVDDTKGKRIPPPIPTRLGDKPISRAVSSQSIFSSNSKLAHDDIAHIKNRVPPPIPSRASDNLPSARTTPNIPTLSDAADTANTQNGTAVDSELNHNHKIVDQSDSTPPVVSSTNDEPSRAELNNETQLDFNPSIESSTITPKSVPPPIPQRRN